MLLMGIDHSKLPATFSCISECSPVNDFIFLGGYTCAEANRYGPLGVTCIVDATNVPKLSKPRNVEYMKVSVDDSEHAALEPHFDAVADKILAVKQKGGKVLVHCAAGISRSTTLVLAYLMKHEGMTLRDAYFFVKEKRPIVSPNPGFWRQLIKYECRLKGPGSESSVAMVKRGLRMRDVPDVYVTTPSSVPTPPTALGASTDSITTTTTTTT